MVRLVPVTDSRDERLRLYTVMRDADLRREMEHGAAVFVAEGVGTIRRALASPYPLRSLLVTPARAEQLADELVAFDADAYVASLDVIAAVAGFDLHRGALALFGRRHLPALEDVVATARCVVVLEGVNDHENLGAIARSASAFGADGLVLDPTSADPLYRRCVRVSMGEVLHVPFARSSRWPTDLDVLTTAGFTLVALTPSPGATDIREVEPPDRVALLLGAEGPGLSDAALARSIAVRIPIRADVDSLNVGHAAAIALHRLASPAHGRAKPTP
jgi:tRNA G18 (ribose-2'-O)-methylase SpoU